jgi:hypothetical protein
MAYSRRRRGASPSSSDSSESDSGSDSELQSSSFRNLRQQIKQGGHASITSRPRGMLGRRPSIDDRPVKKVKSKQRPQEVETNLPPLALAAPPRERPSPGSLPMSVEGRLTQGGPGGRPAPLAARLNRIPAPFRLNLHGIAWKLPTFAHPRLTGSYRHRSATERSPIIPVRNGGGGSLSARTPRADLAQVRLFDL